jgi:hypothetical protein
VPTIEELDRLRALLARLAPLAEKRRGELIEAAEWNQLTDALIALARTVLAEEREGAVTSHEHPDQVGVGWLEPKLRLLLERGPLADPAAVTRLTATERQLARVGARVEELAARLGDVRTRVTDVATRDFVRVTELDRVSRRIEGIGDARDDVNDLRRTLRDLDEDVRRAVEVGQRLDVDGTPLDARDVVDRLAALEELRSAWTAADGTILDAGELERRLAQVRAEAVAGPVDTGFIEDAVGRATAGLREEVVRAAAERAGRTAMEEAGRIVEELHASLGDELTAVRETVEAGLGELDTLVAASVERSAGGFVEAAVAGFEESVTALGERIAKLDGALAATVASVNDLRNRVEVVRAEGLETNSRLRRDLDARVGELEARPAVEPTSEALVGAIAEQLRASLRDDIDARFEGERQELDAALAERVARSVQTEVALATAGVEGQMRAVVTDQLDAERARTDAVIAERVAVATEKLPGLVADEVRRSNAGVREVVATEVGRIVPDLTVIVDRRIDERLPGR